VLIRLRTQRPPRVLVMNDEQGEAQLLRERLWDAGFQVIEAHAHAELCLKLLTWRPDVVLTTAPARPRDARALARLIRRSARRPVPAVIICDRPPEVDICAAVVLRCVLLTEVVRALHLALVGRGEESGMVPRNPPACEA
jgi:CheY-like chemotaxis protein